MRLLEEPINIRRLLVPVKNLTPQTIRTFRFAQLLAETNSGQVTLLHVCPSLTNPEEIAALNSAFELLLEASPQISCEVKIVKSDDVPQVILQETKMVDMVVWRSLRRRIAGGLAVSDVTHQVIKKLTCSMVLFGEPHG
jgi:nucleotide-binding universal stress UspA family protein